MMETRTAAALAARIAEGMERVVVGGERTAFALTVALLARGHALIEGVPGTGKTLAVRAMAGLIGASYRRVQFTPDVLPADIAGTTVFNPQTAQFNVRPGPIFANVLLADEINRTPPKTQSALLEAMEEGHVTIDGEPLALPQPFFVCATQNPIEYEGTYPLPEAQLDRFLVKIDIGYPGEAAELDLLARVAEGFDARSVEPGAFPPVVQGEAIVAAQREVRTVHTSSGVQRYVYDVVAASRSHRQLTLGASPRASVALLIASQAAAAISGRSFVTPDDVKNVAPVTLPHRLIVAPQAEIDGARAGAIVQEILQNVPVPKDADTP
jgi:MoxR-like ATPase